MTINDGKEFDDVHQHALDLKGQYTVRNQDFERYEEMYLLDWQDENPRDKAKDLKITTSPDARNAVLGATRLMVATDPIFSVSDEMIDKPETAEKIETEATRMWNQSGRVANIPIHYDAVLSALLYGEVHIPITRTEDLVKAASKNKSRVERIAKITPFLFECWNPKQGYPEFDNLGLSAYYREISIGAGELYRRYGGLVSSIVASKSNYDPMTLGIFYDLDKVWVWVDDQYVTDEEHGLDNIPVSCTITEGSRLFAKEEFQRQPLLYALMKSGLWNRQNLMMTVLFTNIYHIGLTPTFTYTAGTPTEDPAEFSIDFNNTLIAPVPYGGRLEPLNTKGLVDPSYEVAMNMIEQKGAESTLYKQALGQPIGGSPAYSTVALLSQQGRLPLVSTQRRGGWGISNAMEIAMLWGMEKGFGAYAADRLQPGDIPEDLQIDAKLDIKLPQDKLQQANIASMLTDKRMTSKKWSRENVLNIEQSGAMDEEIQEEIATQQMMDMFTQIMVGMEGQKLQQSFMPPQPQQPPGPQGPQGQPPMQQQGPPMQAEPQANMQPAPGMEGQGFDTGMGGLPPVQGGALPGMGEDVAPTEGNPNEPRPR